MPSVVALIGATATGKSEVALAAAAATGAEIVSADALQVYCGLDIGTAKPTLEERGRIRHHLIDIADPGELFSAGEYARRARAALAEIAARDRPAIVVGGSGLYLRALLSGLSEVPPTPPAIRAELLERLHSEGLAALRLELEYADPATARRLAAGDTQRTLRALAVLRATGRPLSAWLAASPGGAGRLDASKIGLTLPRAVLYDRIEARIVEMIDRGWIDEVQRLLASGVSRDAPALQAIGYRDWIRHLDGELSRAETVVRIVQATRRYAKRQDTWFRREEKVEWCDARRPDRVVEVVRERLAG
jgi:tRNA dimethylallyltransferase